MIVDQVDVDSLSGYNINHLKSRIAIHTKGLPGIDSPINRNWDAARRAALDSQNLDPWMHYEKFEAICDEHGIRDAEAVRSIAATFLHRLGRGVWYGNDWPNEPMLCNTIVRDPAWLAQAFMEVIEHKPTRTSGGLLDHANLSDVWINHGREEDGWRVYPVEVHQRLMRILRAQGVALPTKHSNGERSLVPQLIPTVLPELHWQNASSLPLTARVLRMTTRLEPDVEGIMPRLIAALEPYHVYENGLGIFWEDGIFLRDQGRFENEAIISLRHERSCAFLDVTVLGEEPGFLLNQIDTTIAEVIEFWKGMTRHDTVNCPTRDTEGEFCNGGFKIENIERWLQKKQDSAVCQDCDAEYAPRDLIYGLSNRTRQDDTNDLIRWMAYREQRPAPRSVVIVPSESNWRQIKSWQVLGRTRLQVRLHSELSGALVAKKDITANQGMLKFLAPVAKISALFFGASALPFELPEGVEDIFGEMADTFDRIGEFATGEESRSTDLRQNDEPNLHLVHDFLMRIGLDPRKHGMELARASNGKFYWMSPTELEHHRPLQAVIPSS
ncbi:MAG: hypothetical protein GY927_08530 [bacterium]|nr:hypothetical protein [bacterium]